MRRHRPAAQPLARFLEQRADLVFQRLDRLAGIAAFDLRLRRQVAPGKLFLERIRRCDHAPVVDGAGRAWRDAVHAVIADFDVHHVVVVVMRHRIDRAGLLAGVAPDADLGVDQVLFFERCVHGRFLHLSPRAGRGKSYAAIFTYSNSPGLLSMPTLGGAIQLANLPGSLTGVISDAMKSPTAIEGR